MVNLPIYEIIGELILYGIIILIVFRLLNIVWTCWLGSKLGFGVTWKGNADTWAIVTGASDGIGFEFARNMASKDYAVLLISRSLEKLNNAKDSIQNEFPNSRLRTLQFDLTDTQNYNKIQEVIDDIGKVDVLINNCGQTYEYPEYLLDLPNAEALVNSIIKINVISTTKMLELVMPIMVANKRGIIINVGSMSSRSPIPLLAVYSATKVYVDYLSEALSQEYSNRGVIIQYLFPAYVKTKIAKVRETALSPTARNYVNGAINTVGLETRSAGYWSHKILYIVFDTLGQTIMKYFYVNWLLYVRKRYFDKIQRQTQNKRF